MQRAVTPHGTSRSGPVLVHRRTIPVARPTARGTPPAQRRVPRAPCGAGGDEAAIAATGVVFAPFKEVEPQVHALDALIRDGNVTVSAARTDYTSRLEAAINEQINVEFTNSYIYHALAAFFDRDNVGLPGFAAYFKESSDDERGHANTLMAQQNRRGGRVVLAAITAPVTEFWGDEGDALVGVKLALALEKLNFTKLRQLHAVADQEGDAEMTQFIEDHLLRPQAREVKQAADLFSRVRRAGTGHGVIHIDLELQRRYGYGLEAGGGDGAGGNGVA